MQTAGLQKLTLVDFPGRVACTVFTAGCPWRCPFCHNAALVTPGDFPTYPAEDILSFLETRRGRLDGVAVTGGEPLLHPDLPDFLRAIRAMGFEVKLDTNGMYPERLRAVLDAGLADYVAMDVKNCPARYAETVGVPGFDPAPVAESLAVLRRGGVPFETRTTVVRELHTQADIEAMGAWIAGDQPHFLQVFRDGGGNLTQGLHPWDDETMHALREALLPYLPGVAIRGE